MMTHGFRTWPVTLATIVALAAFFPSQADAALRVVTYNVDADTDRNNDGTVDAADGTYATSSVASVLQAIGNYSLAGNKQAPDVISLQELYAVPSTTLSAIVTNLNVAYGAGTYAYDPTVGATSSTGATGNGPNGLIYNTKTVAVSAVTQIGTPSGSGEARAPLRYQLVALSATTNNTFYLYSDHTKASSGSDNALRRTYELDAVRADADKLGSNAHVIVTGDLNLTGGSSEAAYQDLLAASGTTLSTNGNPNSAAANIVAGAARFYDPLTSSFTTSSSASLKYYTESDDSLTARFDFELLTANTLSTSTSLGLRLVDKSYLAFGNDYYSAAGVLTSANSVGGSVLNAANATTATTGYTTATLNALLAATDHLPVVADYVVVVPEPTTLGTLAIGVIVIRRRRCV